VADGRSVAGTTMWAREVVVVPNVNSVESMANVISPRTAKLRQFADLIEFGERHLRVRASAMGRSSETDFRAEETQRIAP
jgi:hypothetical protein